MPVARILIALMVFLLANTSVCRAEADLPPLPKPIQKLQDEGAQLRYLGRDLGYDGWLAVQDSQAQYFYVTPDQSAFFLGVLFNKNGRAVTFDQLARLKGKNDPILANLEDAPSQRTERPALSKVVDAPSEAVSPPPLAPKAEPGPSRAEALFHDVAEADWFVMGAAKAPVIYMFTDPRCPHCKDFLRDLKPLVDDGKLQIRVIPVGLLAEDSATLAAGLLAARGDAAARLFKFMTGDDAAIDTSDNAAQVSRVDANNTLLMKWKFQGTPMTVYRDKTGKVKLLQGRAKTVETLTEDLP